MNIIPFKAGFPDLKKFTSSGILLNAVREDFVKLKNKGYFQTTDNVGFYIYEIEEKTKFRGVIVSTSLEDYFNQKILGHEETIVEKEQTIVQIAERNNAMTKPIFLTYPDQDAINDFINVYASANKPMLKVDFGDNHSVHTIWNVSNAQDVEKLRLLFEHLVPVSYIADGHHRASMFARYLNNASQNHHENALGLLCAFFPFSMLEIYDFSRKVQLKNGINTANILEKLHVLFEIERLNNPMKPDTSHELTLFIKDESYLLKWKPEILQKGKAHELTHDVELFNTFVLNDILGIEDIQNTSSIDYFNGKESMQKLCNIAQKDSVAVFNFYPLTIQDVIAKANKNQILPPKSTWFEPRIKSGLIIQEF